MAEDLGQIIADAREEARIIARMGNAQQAEYLTTLLDKISEAAEDYLTWLSEEKAHIKSGLSLRTLRRRFRELQETGLAQYDAKHRRQYRSCAIPSRPDVTGAKADALAA